MGARGLSESQFTLAQRRMSGNAKREPLLVQADEMYNFLSIGRCNLATAEEGSKIVNLAEMAIAMGQGGINTV